MPEDALKLLIVRVVLDLSTKLLNIPREDVTMEPEEEENVKQVDLELHSGVKKVIE